MAKKLTKRDERKFKQLVAAHEIEYEWGVCEDGISITIEWGDWKHDHAYMDYLMRTNGFQKIGEQVTEEDGSDAYSSIHSYQKKD